MGCSFAYVLAILTNPHSKTALTQLVGRILRQPYARKTRIAALDESYVFCINRSDVLEEIRKGFDQEGLQDMQGRVVLDGKESRGGESESIGPQMKFKTAAENMVLPAFVIRDGKDWRLVSYEEDILSRVPWTEADISPIFKLTLSREERRDVEIRAGLEEGRAELKRRPAEDWGGREVKIDYAYAAAHLLDTVPNPWIGYEFVEKAFGRLLKRHTGKEKLVANNLVFILEELHKQLEEERDRLAQKVFHRLLEEDVMRFMVVLRDLGVNRLPREAKKTTVRATRLDGDQFVLNLFEAVDADWLNSMEREVASFLEEQGRLYFWYRNIPRKDYYVQGWQRSRIYADFIFTMRDGDDGGYRKVFVLETKGRHLDNPESDYKKSVFALCNEHAQKRTWNELAPAMRGKEIRYEVVFQDEWQRRLTEMLAS